MCLNPLKIICIRRKLSLDTDTFCVSSFEQKPFKWIIVYDHCWLKFGRYFWRYLKTIKKQKWCSGQVKEANFQSASNTNSTVDKMSPSWWTKKKHEKLMFYTIVTFRDCCAQEFHSHWLVPSIWYYKPGQSITLPILTMNYWNISAQQHGLI